MSALDHPAVAPSGVPYVYPEGHDFDPVPWGADVVGDPADEYEPLGWVDPDVADPDDVEDPRDDIGGATYEVCDVTVVRTVERERIKRFRIGGHGPWIERRTVVRCLPNE